MKDKPSWVNNKICSVKDIFKWTFLVPKSDWSSPRTWKPGAGEVKGVRRLQLLIQIYFYCFWLYMYSTIQYKNACNSPGGRYVVSVQYREQLHTIVEHLLWEPFVFQKMHVVCFWLRHLRLDLWGHISEADTITLEWRHITSTSKA